MGTFRGGRKPGTPTSVGSASVDESDLGRQEKKRKTVFGVFLFIFVLLSRFLKVKMPDGTHTTVQLQGFNKKNYLFVDFIFFFRQKLRWCQSCLKSAVQSANSIQISFISSLSRTKKRSVLLRSFLPSFFFFLFFLCFSSFSSHRRLQVPESLTVLQLKDRQVELVANSAVAGLDT